MIRVVLAVVLAAALLGVSLPVAERAERDRNAEIATGELRTIAERADQLAADNDPVAHTKGPATTTLVVRAPQPTLTEGGRLVIEDDRLVWQPETETNLTVESDVPVRVEASISVTDRTRLRLRFVRTDEGAAVYIDRPRIENRSRGQSSRVRQIAAIGSGMPV